MESIVIIADVHAATLCCGTICGRHSIFVAIFAMIGVVQPLCVQPAGIQYLLQMLTVIALRAVNGKLLICRKVHRREAICVGIGVLEVVVVVGEMMVVVVVEPILQFFEIELIEHIENLSVWRLTRSAVMVLLLLLRTTGGGGTGGWRI